MKQHSEWLTCIADPDYEIWSEYPYQLKRRADGWIVSECVNSNGYVSCQLNGRHWYKHRIVALQFLPNPLNLSQVDHINHVKDDNRIANLRWCSASENQRNKSSYKGKPYVFLEQLPPSAVLLESYNDHDLNGVFIDRARQKLYMFNGVCYRELVPYERRGHYYYHIYDVEGSHTSLSHNLLFNDDEEDEE